MASRKRKAEPRLVWLRIDKIPPHPDNPKTHDLEGIKKSIRRFGFRTPVVLTDASGLTSEGHGRVQALLEMLAGGEEAPSGIRGKGKAWLAPVIQGLPPFGSDDDERAFLAAANQLVIRGGWDEQRLVALLRAVPQPELTGFSKLEIAELLAPNADKSRGAQGPSLVEQFGVPPFTTLDARQGYWVQRKREWLELGIQTDLGRAGGLVLDSDSARDPDFYQQKRQVEAYLQRKIPTAEFLRDYYENRQDGGGVTTHGTSTFDPVLAELSYRWFSPPGGSVLDPFAGGAVRGVVAAMLGRSYTGIDLGGAQLKANRKQWSMIAKQAPEAKPPLEVSVKDGPTPVERRGSIWVKREDLFRFGDANGTKARTIKALTERHKPAGLIASGARESTMVSRAAQAAAHLGVPCRIHCPAGRETAGMAEARRLGAELVQHAPGYLTVLRKRAAQDARKRDGWLELPWALICPEAADASAAEAKRTRLGRGVKRLVVCVGSGMSLAGLLRQIPARLPVLGVCVGADPKPQLNQYGPAGWKDRVELVPSGSPYSRPAPVTDYEGLRLDSHYEAKCIPHLRPGDLLWIIGTRDESQPTTDSRPDPIEPRWIEGDSTRLDSLLKPRDQFDLLFSCPPYFDLERYSKDERDLSNMSWEGFLEAYRGIIAAGCARLRDDRFAVWVVSDIRDKGAGGYYRGLVAETVRAFEAAGLGLLNQAVLLTPLGSVAIISRRSFLRTRALGRSHQEVLVFCKGSARAAADACGPVEIPSDLVPGAEA